MPAFRRSIAVLAVGLVALGGAACSSSSSSSPSTTRVAPKPIALAPAVTQTTLVINGKTVTVPREEYTPTEPIAPQTDHGQQIIITTKGVLPQQLIAPASATLTWTNLTTKPVSVRFAATGITSGEIAPGGSWSYKVSGSQSIGYETSTGFAGQVGVGVLPLPPIPTTTTAG